MFGRKKKIDPKSTDTVIGEGTILEGTTRSEASIRIEGTINGTIDCVGDVTIGEKGIVKSNVSANDITIAGVLTGEANAKGKLTITSKGKLIGNLYYATIVIEEGGIFLGESKQHNAVPSQDNSFIAPTSNEPPTHRQSISATYPQKKA